MQRDRLVYLLIPLAALIAILPLLLNGCSCGHDFDFHLVNWMEAARQFTHGNLHPHWAYTPAWNAGEPRFVFYPPASWTLGAILGLLLPWTWTPIAYTWLALTAAGLAMHRLARDFAGPVAAAIAAVIYTVNPYMLFTAYERTAYAELLAAAWIPFLFHAILRRRITIHGIAIPVALLWITNAPAAVMSCYVLALLTAIRLILQSDPRNELQFNPAEPAEAVSSSEANHSSIATRQEEKESTISTDATHHFTVNPAAQNNAVISTESNHSLIVSRGVEKPASLPSPPTQTRLEFARNILAGTALGLGLAAFYILPAAYERRFVQIAMALTPGMRIEDNFLFHHTGDILHDEVLHTASLIALILLVASAIVLLIAVLRVTKSGALYLDSEREASRASAIRGPRRALLHVGVRIRGPRRALLHVGVMIRSALSNLKAENGQQTRISHSSGRPTFGLSAVGSPQELAPRPPAFLLPALALLTISILLLLTPITAVLWNHIPELAFLQFPWRLLAILAAVLGLAVALALAPLKLRPAAVTALALSLAASLTYPAYTVFHQACDPEDTVPSRLALFGSNRGSEPTDEYTPTPADNDSLAQANPPSWLSANPDAKAPANAAANAAPGPAPMRLDLNSPVPQTLILNLRDFPAWRITLNGNPITDRDQRDDGLLALPVPAGPSTLSIAYIQTLDQTLGDAITLVSLCLLLLCGRSNSVPDLSSRPHPEPSPMGK